MGFIEVLKIPQVGLVMVGLLVLIMIVQLLPDKKEKKKELPSSKIKRVIKFTIRLLVAFITVIIVSTLTGIMIYDYKIISIPFLFMYLIFLNVLIATSPLDILNISNTEDNDLIKKTSVEEKKQNKTTPISTSFKELAQMDIEKLKKLDELKEKGLLTEEEFNEQKNELLNKTGDTTPKINTSFVLLIIGIFILVAIISKGEEKTSSLTEQTSSLTEQKIELPEQIERAIEASKEDMIGVPEAFLNCYEKNIRLNFKEALQTKKFTPYENRYGSDAYLAQTERLNFILEIINETQEECIEATRKLSPSEIKTTF